MINSGREWDWMDDYVDKEYNFIVEAIESGIVVGVKRYTSKTHGIHTLFPATQRKPTRYVGK